MYFLLLVDVVLNTDELLDSFQRDGDGTEHNCNHFDEHDEGILFEIDNNILYVSALVVIL